MLRSVWPPDGGKPALLGEGPLWSEAARRLLFVDIHGQRLIGWSPDDNSAREWPFPEGPCWIIERADGDGYMMGFKKTIRHVRFSQRGVPEFVAEVASPIVDAPGIRFNDAKATPSGHIFFGSMSDSEIPGSGLLYRLNHDLTITPVDSGYTVCNGPAVSLDGKTLYHADSPTRTVFAYDLSPDGHLSHRRAHINFGERQGFPDGMTVDAEGGLWVAHWDGCRVSRFSPDGIMERTIFLPCSRVTSLVFYGSDYDRLAITTASIGRTDETSAGHLFTVAGGARGLPPAKFGVA